MRCRVLPPSFTQTVTENTNLVHNKQLNLVELYRVVSFLYIILSACKYANFADLPFYRNIKL
jgi:hypothetical protein